MKTPNQETYYDDYCEYPLRNIVTAIYMDF